MEKENIIAEQVAAHLLNIQAVKLNVNDPFIWASGIKSPIYCDNRRILSYPEARDFVREALSQKIKEHFADAEVIAGVATGAIAHGVLVAQQLNLPFIYVRSSPKEHGLGNQIEGDLPEGKKVAVIEDLVSTGKSSLAAVDALIDAKAQVLGMVAIFTYEMDQATKNMIEAKCPLYTLSNYSSLVKQAINMGIIPHSSMEALEKWRENPQGWRE